MKQIKVKANQTIYDIAIEQYGTCAAVDELLKLNPDITNDPSAKATAEIVDTDYYIDLAITKGLVIVIDPDSKLKQSSITRELQDIDITTYNNGKDN